MGSGRFSWKYCWREAMACVRVCFGSSMVTMIVSAQGARFLPGWLERHDLDGGVAHFVEEAVDDGAVEEDVPACARRLAEDHVGDVLLAGKFDQSVGDFLVLQDDDVRAEVAGHAFVFLEASQSFGIAVAVIGAGSIDVDGKPVGGEASSDAGARAENAIHAGTGGEADHHL